MTVMELDVKIFRPTYIYIYKQNNLFIQNWNINIRLNNYHPNGAQGNYIGVVVLGIIEELHPILRSTLTAFEMPHQIL